jgi:putative membrane protein
MIVKQSMSYLRMLFAVRDSSLERTMPRIAAITLFSVAVTLGDYWLGTGVYTLTTAPFVLIGVALGIFLGFRNNTAYDRYWEGRKLWGNLVNTSRSYARQLSNFVLSADDERAVTELRRELIYKTIAFAHATRHHLRETDPSQDLEAYLTPAEMGSLAEQRNVPVYILRRCGQRVRDAWQAGFLDKYHLTILEGSLVQFTDILGGCERIRNTPVPFGYTVLMHRIVSFYCFFLPFGIYDTVGLLTPLVVFLIAHALFGLDEIGNEIENPFGTAPQHLPLLALCRTIEVNLRQELDEAHVPEFIRPVGGVLP